MHSVYYGSEACRRTLAAWRPNSQRNRPLPSAEGVRKLLFAFLRRNATRKSSAALVIWRVEARLATPVALAMGGIMAVYSAVFLFLRDGENVMHELRAWMRERSWARKYALPIAERRDRTGTVYRAMAVPGTVMLMGPFWRPVTCHLFRMPRALAYSVSVGGSIPHSLFWTGLVLGGLWVVAIQPGMEWVWDEIQELT